MENIKTLNQKIARYPEAINAIDCEYAKKDDPKKNKTKSVVKNR